MEDVKKMKTLDGICPIIMAPFCENGDLDPESFQRLVRHLLQTGIQGLTLFGLVTEFYKLTDAEKQTLQKIMLAETSRSSTVAGVVSITDHAWEVAVIRAIEAQEAGADALMVLPPFFLGASEQAVIQHLQAIAAAVSVPIVVQYAPVQTGVKLSPDVFVRLSSEFANIKFVKVECQPPGPYVSALQQGAAGTIKSLVGYAGVQMPDVLARGATGIQPGCSFSEIYVRLFGLFAAGKRSEMLALYRRLLPYISYWMQGIELLIKAEKIILQRRGIIASDYCRAISYVMDPSETRLIDAFLEEFAEFFK